MSLYTKSMAEITLADVDAFCQQGLPENIAIEYKEDFPRRLERTVAAMANTHGGLIFLGVEEDAQRRPCLPCKGVSLSTQSHVADRVTSICLHAIYPPLLGAETAVIPLAQPPAPGDSPQGVVVIRVHESDLCHWTDERTRVYVRAPGQNMPVDDREAKEHELLALLNRREQSIALREHLLTRMRERGDFAAHGYGSQTRDLMYSKKPTLTLSLASKFPRSPLLHPLDLRLIAQKAQRSLKDADYDWQWSFPHTSDLRPVAGGIARKNRAQYVEVNEFGFSYLCDFDTLDPSLSKDHQKTNPKISGILVHRVTYLIGAWVAFSTRVAQTVGLQGLLVYRFSLNNAAGRVLLSEINQEWGKEHRLPEDSWEHTEEVLSFDNSCNGQAVAERALERFLWACGDVNAKSTSETLLRDHHFATLWEE